MNEEEKYSQIQFHLNDYHLLNIKSVIKKVKYDIKYVCLLQKDAIKL